MPPVGRCQRWHQLGASLGGAIIAETVFAKAPGMGNLNHHDGYPAEGYSRGHGSISVSGIFIQPYHSSSMSQYALIDWRIKAKYQEGRGGKEPCWWERNARTAYPNEVWYRFKKNKVPCSASLSWW